PPSAAPAPHARRNEPRRSAPKDLLMTARVRPRHLSLLLVWLTLTTSWPLQAVEALRYVRIFDDGQSHATLPARQDSFLLHRSWPFCPTDRIPCSAKDLAWVEIGIQIDVYSQRRNDAHDSIVRIVGTTMTDFAPLTAALRDHFERQG